MSNFYWDVARSQLTASWRNTVESECRFPTCAHTVEVLRKHLSQSSQRVDLLEARKDHLKLYFSFLQ